MSGYPDVSFTAYRKITSPRSASSRHTNFKLRLNILSEKSPADSFKACLQELFNSVPNDIKESELVARISDLSRDALPVFVTGSQWAYIDDRNLHLKFRLLMAVLVCQPHASTLSNSPVFKTQPSFPSKLILTHHSFMKVFPG